MVRACDYISKSLPDYDFENDSLILDTKPLPRFLEQNSKTFSLCSTSTDISLASFDVRFSKPEPTESLNQVTSNSGDMEDEAIVDSGASVHIIGHKRYFVGKMRPCNVNIRCADNEVVNVTECGDILISVNGFRILLRDVLYVPNGPTLLSVGRITSSGTLTFTFDLDLCILSRRSDRRTISVTKFLNQHGGGKLYHLKFMVPDFEQLGNKFSKTGQNTRGFAYQIAKCDKVSLRLVHNRYNHSCPYYCSKIEPKCKGNLEGVCDACAVAGLKNRPYFKTAVYDRHVKMKVENKILDHSNLPQQRIPQQSFDKKDQDPDVVERDIGPSPLDFDKEVTDSKIHESSYPSYEVDEREDDPDKVQHIAKVFGKIIHWDTKVSPAVSVRGNKYAFCGVCKDTRMGISLLGKCKNDFIPLLKGWIKRFKITYGFSPALFHFDQGTEFYVKEFVKWLEEDQGISVTYSCKAQSNQNPYAENRIGVVWTAMLKILAHSGVPFQFWDYAWEYAMTVQNHIPHRGTNWRSPLENAGLRTIHERIFVFGSEGYFKLYGVASNEARARRGVFLGIDPRVKGWLFLDIETRTVMVARTAIFNEVRYPFIDVMKPCLIMLKFGVWPKINVDDDVIEPIRIPVMGGQKKLITLDSNETEYEKESEHDSLDQKHDNSNIIPFCSDNSPVPPNHKSVSNEDKQRTPKESSPIPNSPSQRNLQDFDEQDWNLDTPPRLPTPAKINLDTPEICKGGLKKFSKLRTHHFGDNMYLKSGNQQRLKVFEDRLTAKDNELNPTSKITKSTPKVTKSPPDTPSPDGKVDGVDAWEIRHLTKSKVNKDGSKSYYGRWVGAYKDEWFHESQLKGAQDAIDDFENSEKLKVKSRKDFNHVKVGEININSKQNPNDFVEKNMDSDISNIRNTLRPSDAQKNLEKDRTVHDFVKSQAKRREGLRKSTMDLRKKYNFDDQTYSKNLGNPEYSKCNPHTPQEAANILKLIEDREKDLESRQILESAIESIRVNYSESPDPFEDFAKAVEEMNLSQSNNVEDDPFDYSQEITEKISGIDIALSNEIANKISTEFPKPVNFECPKSVNIDQQIALAIDVITKLVDGEEIVVDGGTLTKPDIRSRMLKHQFAEKFIEGEQRELYELWNKGTFKITLCPPGRTPITCRWVYDMKRNDANEIYKFKARLVVQGFKQEEGVDFQKTFSSVAQMRTFRLLCSLAVKYDLRITQYDIGNAFVQADMDKEMYMTFPPGYPNENNNPNEVLRLIKALYGAKQSARLWKELLVKRFDKAGLELCQTESGVLQVKDKTKGMCFVNLHVDDYLIFTRNEKLRKQIEEVLASVFDVKPQGELRYFLGIVVDRTDDGKERKLTLSQKPYIDRLMVSTGFDKEKPSDTIGNSATKLSVQDCPAEGEEKPDWKYMSVGGSILYAAFATRPDVCQRVVQLCRFNANPGLSHVKEQQHLLKYLLGSSDLGITFSHPVEDKSEKVTIQAFCDSDWAGCPDTRRSTCGFVVLVCGGPVAWKSHLKKTLALSSCEAEFMALNDVAREVMWICRFLTEIGVPYDTPRIYCDSNSAIYWAEDPVQHQRNKHVELKYYYIRDIVGKELVKLYRINTRNNPADMQTKLHTKQMTTTLRPTMMGHCKPILEE